jgi:hypothetical protein
LFQGEPVAGSKDTFFHHTTGEETGGKRGRHGDDDNDRDEANDVGTERMSVLMNDQTCVLHTGRSCDNDTFEQFDINELCSYYGESEGAQIASSIHMPS